ncbi:hypothetical protein ACOMHN_049316 [Nucella lapillus]
MITPGGMASEFGEKVMYSSLTRVGPNLNSLPPFMLSVLQRYHWRRLSLIYDPEGQGDILEKLCYFPISALHQGLK